MANQENFLTARGYVGTVFSRPPPPDLILSLRACQKSTSDPSNIKSGARGFQRVMGHFQTRVSITTRAGMKVFIREGGSEQLYISSLHPLWP